MTQCFRIRPANGGDLPAVLELLRAAHRPTEDLRAEHLALVADGDAGTQGVIGIA